MRVIAGTLKGRILRYPTQDIRPTTDKIRGAVFNMISANFPDLLANATVCDIFAGAGSVGIEAISRGAQKVIFIENRKTTIRYLYENLRDIQEKARVIKADARKILSSFKEKFDLIYLDPPYNQNLIEPILKKIAKYKLLKPKGIIVIESHIKENYEVPQCFSIYKRKQYKNTLITILTNKEQL
ncbi:MAG: 16S rRNA (guanine(966)-N(2))-methyltransferase RsmD [candidate division WOR-3 bacterium]|nr:16S rRNA (guanine(966)-N(2))-methyltransferase RsmD [candidate division WOR-3 bacterium]MCX7757038.1 16S rRNA (guanine(966)-N(2))-methyltransferase RsmD [candidate division WOR-3 bacterium]MDW7987262.1 16S rRNA (guanine(966)-N(2))-methyltransferase RsmD [candidate division WOR-3 bacterium]